MRHCFNENVEVYEVQSDTFAGALRTVADAVEGSESTFVNLTSAYIDGEYVVTVYVHGGVL